MEYTLEQLKAMAYDTLADIELKQRQLREINSAIVNYKEPATEKTVVESK